MIMLAMIAKVMNIFNIGIYLIKFETAPVVRSFECFLCSKTCVLLYPNFLMIISKLPFCGNETINEDCVYKNKGFVFINASFVFIIKGFVYRLRLVKPRFSY